MRLFRSRIVVGASALLIGAGLVLVTGSAAYAVTALPVYPADLGTVNYSASSTSFDGYTTEYTSLPDAGTKWALDVENKPVGTYSQTPVGLQLNGVDAAATQTKMRFMYYIGSGGYPAVDESDTTLAAFVDSLSWVVKYPNAGNGTDSGMGVAGIDFEAQAPAGGSYHRVSGFVQCQIVAPHGAQTAFSAEDLGDCRWAVNSRMIGGTYTPGQYLYSGVDGQGTTSDLLAQFGGYQMVAFGPNVGRFAPPSASVVIQSLHAFDVEFSFVEAEKSAPAAPPADEAALVAALKDQDVAVTPAPDPTDQSAPYDLTASWDAVDGWVDVYAYSSPVHLGVASVAFGQVSFTGLDLSGLAPGAHTLVLVGQSSGAISAYSIAVGLPKTGQPVDVTAVSISGLLLLGVGIAILGTVRRRRAN